VKRKHGNNGKNAKGAEEGKEEEEEKDHRESDLFKIRVGRDGALKVLNQDGNSS